MTQSTNAGTPFAPTSVNTASAAVQPQTAPATNANTEVKPNIPAHYLVTVRGQAAVSGGTPAQTANYNETIACPDLGPNKADGHYLTYCLSDERGESLLSQAIKRTHGHCEVIRTHELINRVFVDASGNQTQIKNVTVVNGQQVLEIFQMRYTELQDYVKERKYEIDTDLYETTDELRMAVDAYEKDKDSFVLEQEKRREDVRIKKDAELLNNLTLTPVQTNNAPTANGLDI